MAEKLQYKLEAFEGPLDLLLFLISKHKLNICDINISELLQQYLATIEGIENIDDLEGASEFLEMAARLVYIKTAMLLPRYDEEGETLRRELQGELIEYQACKQVAEMLRKRDVGNATFFRVPQIFDVDMTYTREHEKEDVLRAYMAALGRRQRKLPPPASAFATIIHRRMVSVASKAIVLLKNLYKRGTMEVKELFTTYDRSERVAMFLALLELAKNGRVRISEDCQSIKLNKDRKGKADDGVAVGAV